jgi:hypothetical protein
MCTIAAGGGMFTRRWRVFHTFHGHTSTWAIQVPEPYQYLSLCADYRLGDDVITAHSSANMHNARILICVTLLMNQYAGSNCFCEHQFSIAKTRIYTGVLQIDQRFLHWYARLFLCRNDLRNAATRSDREFHNADVVLTTYEQVQKCRTRACILALSCLLFSQAILHRWIISCISNR